MLFVIDGRMQKMYLTVAYLQLQQMRDMWSIFVLWSRPQQNMHSECSGSQYTCCMFHFLTNNPGSQRSVQSGFHICWMKISIPYVCCWLLHIFNSKKERVPYSFLKFWQCISLCHFPVISSLLDPNIFLSTLLSNTLDLHPSLSLRDEVPHSYKTKSKITVPYILNFIFLDSKLEDRRFCTKWQQSFPDFNLLLISSWMQFTWLFTSKKF